MNHLAVLVLLVAALIITCAHVYDKRTRRRP
jgi:hypothetical protein